MKSIMKSSLILTVFLSLSPLFIAGNAAAQATPTSVASLRNTNPYYYVGRVTMNHGSSSYIGSGTVIKPSSVLTAGHNLYDRTTGWSTNVVFQRSYHNGTYASTTSASRLFILGGYSSAVGTYGSTSSQAFSRDTGGIICFTRPMNGGYAGWWQNPAMLTGTAYNMSLGYGGVVHSGKELLRSSPTRVFYQVYGAWYRNTSYGIEGGMSGGPLFAQSGGNWYVVAVNVSGDTNSISTGSGVRAIDVDTANLIKTNLP